MGVLSKRAASDIRVPRTGIFLFFFFIIVTFRATGPVGKMDGTAVDFRRILAENSAKGSKSSGVKCWEQTRAAFEGRQFSPRLRLLIHFSLRWGSTGNLCKDTVLQPYL